MIRPVIGTIVARVAITGLSLLSVALTGRHLGVEGLGSIGLLVLGVTITLVLAHAVGGGGLVYVVPRTGVRHVLAPAYGWAVIVSLLAWMVFTTFSLVPEGLGPHVAGLAFLQATNSIHLNILVARERIGTHNTLAVSQAAIQLVAFAILLRVHGPELMDYVNSAYLALGSMAILSGWQALRMPWENTGTNTSAATRALFAQGSVAQLTNLFQLLNYRASYYLIEALHGTAALGAYSVTMQLAEGTWLIPKSIGGVLYSKVSNLEERRRQLQYTVILFKVAVVAGSVCCVVLLALPNDLFRWLFGTELPDLRPLLLGIVPGLVAMSGSQVLSHYFSGTGQVRHNLFASGLGLVVTMAVGWPLIAMHGLVGATFTASLAYSAAVIYQLVVFIRRNGIHAMDLAPHGSDLRKARSLWYMHRRDRIAAQEYL